MKYTGEQAMAEGKRYYVTLDGEELNDVVECDDELGYAIVYSRDEDGNMIIQGDEFKSEWRWGVITVTPAPAAAPAPVNTSLEG